MIARRTLLALSLLAGVGVLASSPAHAGHDRATVIYRVGGYDRDYCPPERHRARGHQHYRGHGRHHGRYEHRRWEHSSYSGYRYHDRDEPRYRIHIEYGN